MYHIYKSTAISGGRWILSLDNFPPLELWRPKEKEKNFLSVLPNLLNAYRAACQYGSEIPSPDCEKHTVLGLKKTQKWKDSEPLIQSYLSSTIIFLNHVTDSEILAFALTPVTVHLWATGERKVPSASFLIMRDAATQLSLNCLEFCLIKRYKAFIARSKFLADSLAELYSLDVPRSCSKALVSIQQLATILRQCLHTKEKETMEKIYSWQYINCVDLWVKYVCLSSSSRDFIPVTSLVLDSLEYIGTGKPDVPKQWLKSRLFQEECALSVIELLSAHFAQWSYHISFPELAAIPLIRLRKFNEKITVESLRRPVKRLIDMVEQNIEFVNRKREEISFSPKDKVAVDSFLQEIKADSKQTPFTQYYTDIIKRSLSRSSVMQRYSKAAQKKLKKGKANVPKKSTNKENAEKSLDSVNQLQRNQLERKS
ncbi:hypothetical protein MKW98_013416 [Papaver atlanticum]|uniref:Uncharacterized protein n=1 Tax=Papaver atlanticum TaxID=357466 RepID=A0AAD4XK69_9MAGN|nr:hypothetical protein MKW98_013416 [Papaver atlanticum]